MGDARVDSRPNEADTTPSASWLMSVVLYIIASLKKQIEIVFVAPVNRKERFTVRKRIFALFRLRELRQLTQKVFGIREDEMLRGIIVFLYILRGAVHCTKYFTL